MSDERVSADSPRCLQCGHVFEAVELAAITARAHHEDLSLIHCASCGACNVARVQPHGGFNHQPGLDVLRIAKHDSESDEVFHQTVEPGVQVDPTTAGESH